MNSSLAFAVDVYAVKTQGEAQQSTPHPKQTKGRRGFRQPRNAYDPTQPDLLHVVI